MEINRIIDDIGKRDVFHKNVKDKKLITLLKVFITSCVTGDVKTIKTMLYHIKEKEEIRQHILSSQFYIYYILYMNENYHILKYFISINLINALTKNEKGYTILHYECFKKKPMVIRELISKSDINVNIKDKEGRAPLHHLFSIKAVKALLSHPLVDINVTTNDGWTPLHIACLSDNYRAAKLLLLNGAKINVKDISGKTLVDLVRFKSDINIYELLLRNRDENMNYLTYNELVYNKLIKYKDFKIITLDNKFNTDIIYYFLKNVYVQSPLIYFVKFIKYLLINEFNFSRKRLKEVDINENLQYLIDNLIHMYKCNKTIYSITWRLEIYRNLTHSAIIYNVMDKIKHCNFNVDDININVYKFYHILKKLPNRLKRNICCKVYGITLSYIPEFFVNKTKSITIKNDIIKNDEIIDDYVEDDESIDDVSPYINKINGDIESIDY